MYTFTSTCNDSPDGDDSTPQGFVGVGIDAYDGHPAREHAVAEVRPAAERLRPAFADEPLVDADRAQLDADRLSASAPAGRQAAPEEIAAASWPAHRPASSTAPSSTSMAAARRPDCTEHTRLPDGVPTAEETITTSTIHPRAPNHLLTITWQPWDTGPRSAVGLS